MDTTTRCWQGFTLWIKNYASAVKWLDWNKPDGFGILNGCFWSWYLSMHFLFFWFFFEKPVVLRYHDLFSSFYQLFPILYSIFLMEYFWLQKISLVLLLVWSILDLLILIFTIWPYHLKSVFIQWQAPYWGWPWFCSVFFRILDFALHDFYHSGRWFNERSFSPWRCSIMDFLAD